MCCERDLNRFTFRKVTSVNEDGKGRLVELGPMVDINGPERLELKKNVVEENIGRSGNDP